MLHQVTVTTASLLAANSSIMALYSDQMSLWVCGDGESRGQTWEGLDKGGWCRKKKKWLFFQDAYQTHRQKAENSGVGWWETALFKSLHSDHYSILFADELYSTCSSFLTDQFHWVTSYLWHQHHMDAFSNCDYLYFWSYAILTTFASRVHHISDSRHHTSVK